MRDRAPISLTAKNTSRESAQAEGENPGAIRIGQPPHVRERALSSPGIWVSTTSTTQTFSVLGGRYVCGALHVSDVSERDRRYVVRRVLLPARGDESFTVIGPDLRPVKLVDEFLAWLTDCERSPNTVEAYAHDLRAFWTFLDERGLGWERVGVMELGEFAAWARRPAENVVVLADQAARLSARTVNRMSRAVPTMISPPSPLAARGG